MANRKVSISAIIPEGALEPGFSNSKPAEEQVAEAQANAPVYTENAEQTKKNAAKKAANKAAQTEKQAAKKVAKTNKPINTADETVTDPNTESSK